MTKADKVSNLVAVVAYVLENHEWCNGTKLGGHECSVCGGYHYDECADSGRCNGCKRRESAIALLDEIGWPT